MGKAKYLEVVEWIQKQIEDKQIAPGDKLYSENELSQKFQLSRQTIRHAIGMLEDEGIVIRVRGSGTYINENYKAVFADRNRIAVITTYVDGYIFPKTIQGIENVLSDAGYSVQIAFTNNMVERERGILEDLISKNDVAGIIIEPTRSGLPNPNISLYQELRKMRIPILFINSFYKDLDIPHVSLNDKVVAKRGTQYLIDSGHKNIGAIFKLDDGQGHLRFAGFLEAMKEAGIAVDDSAVVWIDTFDVNNFHLSKEKILGRLKNSTAVLCYNDQVAYKLITMLQEENRQVPQDVSVIGIDGSELTVMGDVKITSLPHPLDKLGEKAANNLLQMIRNPFFNGNYEFDTEVIEQASVRSIKDKE